MYSIIIHAIGNCAEAGDTVAVPRSDFSARALAENLATRWAWAGVIVADGPCVAIRWES